MKKWHRVLILSLGVLLLAASFAVYAVRVSNTVILPEATPEEVEQLTRQYGLDRPMAAQYSGFLAFFLPGVAVLGVYGLLGLRRPDSPQSVFLRAFLALMMLASLVAAINYLFLAPQTVVPYSLGFWLTLVLAGLYLAVFCCCLIIWNEYRWGVRGFLIASFFIFTLNLLGGVDLLSTFFWLSSAVVLFFIIRPVWTYME